MYEQEGNPLKGEIEYLTAKCDSLVNTIKMLKKRSKKAKNSESHQIFSDFELVLHYLEAKILNRS